MIKAMKSYVNLMNSINKKVEYICVLILALNFVMLYDVVARYIFNRPTIWALDVNSQIMCFYLVMIGGYTLSVKMHIRSDIFYYKWSKRKKAWSDLFCSFLGIAFLLGGSISAIRLALRSFSLDEHKISIWAPPLYYLRLAIAVGFILFLMQLIAEMFKNILFLSNNTDDEG